MTRLRHRVWWQMDKVSDRLWNIPWVDRNDNRFSLTEKWQRLERLVCFFLGHVPIRDQCNIPEHDYCSYCQKGLPGQAEK